MQPQVKRGLSPKKYSKYRHNKRNRIIQSEIKPTQKSERQLLRNIQCKQLYRYLTPVSQRKQLGYIKSCCMSDPDVNYTNIKTDAVGLDCQMILTNVGPQIIRVVIVNIQKKILYDQWFGIRVDTKVVDLITHITGIDQQTYKSKIQKKKSYDLKDRQQIMSIINNKIIIGHDLTNDINLLDIKHQLFIDTVALLPHHFGFPFKNKLKEIAFQYLKKHIQWGFHDPLQDCLSSLQIVQKHVNEGRGTIQIQAFPVFKYHLNNGLMDCQLIMKHAQLQLNKILVLILRGSRALSIQIQHQYQSDWDYVVVYDIESQIDGRLIKLPNIDISFFDKHSFQKHLRNNDISYLEIFFMPEKCRHINKIQFPYLNINIDDLRSSLGFHLNKSKLKIKRFRKQLQKQPHYKWKILKAHHLAIRFMDFFIQLFQVYQLDKEQKIAKQNIHKQNQNIEHQVQKTEKSNSSFNDLKQEMHEKDNLRLNQIKKKIQNINIKRMNQVWYDIENQFKQNKNFEAAVTKLSAIENEKLGFINSICSKTKRLRYKDKMMVKPNKKQLKGKIQLNKIYQQVSEKDNENVKNENQQIIKKEEQNIEQLEIVKFLRSNPVEQIEKYKIIWKRHKLYPNLIQFHYMQSANFSYRIARQCRGIILNQQKKFQIVAFPYQKFFDFNDEKFSQVSLLDWQSTKVYQKKDDSLAFLYYYNNKWHVASSTVPDGSNNYCFAKNQTTKQFSQQFWSIFYSLGFQIPNYQDRFKTFVFEIMSKDHIIVVKRNLSQLCLHGVRDIKTLKQQDHLPYGAKYKWIVAQPIQIPKQQLNLQSLIKKVELLCPLKSQGFVLCDKNWTRIKIKSSSYVRINWLGELNLGFNKDPKKYILIQIILSGQAETFIKYCPEWQKIIKQFLQKINKLNKNVIQVYEKCKHLPQKEFANQLQKYEKNFRNFVFAIRSNPKLYYGKAQTILNPKKFYSFICEYL